MPIYEYRCQSCGDVTEVIQKITDKPLRRCGKCSGKLKKLISRTSFQLKGAGWYSQGYSNAPPKPAPAEAKDSGKDSTGSPKKSKDSGDSSKSGSDPVKAAASAGG